MSRLLLDTGSETHLNNSFGIKLRTVFSVFSNQARNGTDGFGYFVIPPGSIFQGQCASRASESVEILLKVQVFIWQSYKYLSWTALNNIDKNTT